MEQPTRPGPFGMTWYAYCTRCRLVLWAPSSDKAIRKSEAHKQSYTLVFGEPSHPVIVSTVTVGKR